MKELSIEEKAKRYDEVIEIAKEINNEQQAQPFNVMTRVFPELKESEDELTWLKRFIQEEIDCLIFDIRDYEDRIKLENLQRSLSWLEKQRNKDMGISDTAKQKLKDNLDNALEKETPESWNKFLEGEPKFKVGEWIVYNDNLYYIGNIALQRYYECLRVDGTVDTFSLGIIDSKSRLWTIQDARDGDVLATLDYILIFKEFLKNDGGISYCHYDFGAGNPQFIWSEDKNWYFGKEAIIHPATKEQRDILFQKMKEAGYEWNAGIKQLKKVEQKLTDEEMKALLRTEYEKGRADAIAEKQKPAWSEEDEKHFIRCKGYIEAYVEPRKDDVRWFKSLRERVLPQQQKWSEEDERNIKELLYLVEANYLHSEEPHDRLINFLEFLRPQNRWKPSGELDEESYQVGIKRVLENPESYGLTKYNWMPSDEQMENLSRAFNGGTYRASLLMELYQDLNKLRGE